MLPSILPPPYRLLGDVYGLSAAAISRLARCGVDVEDPGQVADYYARRRPGRRPRADAPVFTLSSAEMAARFEALAKAMF